MRTSNHGSGIALRRSVAALAFVLVMIRDAHAYVDPGTGAMILQIIGAAVAGVLFYFKAIRDKISSWFSRLTGRSNPPTKQDES